MTEVVAKVLAVVTALTASVWVLWSTWEIAAGGQLPILGWSVGPSLVGAYVFLIVAELVATTAAARVSALVCMPLLRVAGRRPVEPEPMTAAAARALERTWGTMGSLVLDVEHLRVGHVYHLAAGVSEYRGPVRQPRPPGSPPADGRSDDAAEVWYAFEPARYVESDGGAAPAPLSRQAVLDQAREVPARREVAREAFRAIRSSVVNESRDQADVGAHRRESLLLHARRLVAGGWLARPLHRLPAGRAH